MPDDPQPMNLRAFAKRVGCSHQNVSAGVRSGRLERSIRWIRGRPVIADPDLAEQEWRDNLNPLMSPGWRAAQ